MLTETQQHERTEFIAGLREMADWYESRPELRAPDYIDPFTFFARNKEHFLELRRAADLHHKEESCGEWLCFNKRCRGKVRLQITIEKEKTCRRVKVGERVLPAVPEHTVPAQPERVEEVYEWRCDEPLLANGEAV